MPLTIACAACKQQLRVPDQAAGKQVKCPKCQHVFTAQDPSIRAQPTAHPERPQPVLADAGSGAIAGANSTLIWVFAACAGVALLAAGGLLAVAFWVFVIRQPDAVVMSQPPTVKPDVPDLEIPIAPDPEQPLEKQVEIPVEAPKRPAPKKQPDVAKQPDAKNQPLAMKNFSQKKKSDETRQPNEQSMVRADPNQPLDVQDKKKDPPAKTDPVPLPGSKDGQAKGKDGDAKAPAGPGKSVRGKEKKTEEGLKLTFINLPSDKLVGELIWTTGPQGETSFVALTNEGVLSRISVPGLVEEKKISLGPRCSYLALSSEGLVVTSTQLGEVWLVDAKSLEVKKKIKAPNVLRALAVPALKFAFAVDAGGVSILDVTTGKFVKQFKGTIPVRNARLSPDGKSYFAIDGVGRLISLTIEGAELAMPQLSPAIALQNVRGICVSPDGKYVCVPSKDGNVGAAGTYIFDTASLQRPELVLKGAGAHTVAFDPAGQVIYTQNLKFQLLIFGMDGTKLRELNLTAEHGYTDNSLQILPHPKSAGLLLVQMTSAVLLVDLTGLAGAGPDPKKAGDGKDPGKQPSDSKDPARHQGEGRVHVKEEGFSIVAPKGWETTATAGKNPFLLSMGPKDGAPNLNVVASPHDGTKIEDMPAQVKQQMLKQFKNWKLIDDGFVMIDGKKAYRLTLQRYAQQLSP